MQLLCKKLCNCVLNTQFMPKLADTWYYKSLQSNKLAKWAGVMSDISHTFHLWILAFRINTIFRNSHSAYGLKKIKVAEWPKGSQMWEMCVVFLVVACLVLVVVWLFCWLGNYTRITLRAPANLCREKVAEVNYNANSATEMRWDFLYIFKIALHTVKQGQFVLSDLFLI